MKYYTQDEKGESLQAGLVNEDFLSTLKIGRIWR